MKHFNVFIFLFEQEKRSRVRGWRQQNATHPPAKNNES